MAGKPNKYREYIEPIEARSKEVDVINVRDMFEEEGFISYTFMRNNYIAVPERLAINALDRYVRRNDNSFERDHWFEKYDKQNVNLAYGSFIQSRLGYNFIGFYDDISDDSYLIVCLTIDNDGCLNYSGYDFYQGEMIIGETHDGIKPGRLMFR